MTTKTEKAADRPRFVRIEDLPKREPKPAGRPADLSRMITTTTGPVMDDHAFVARYANAEELAGLRAAIEERRRTEPRFTFWRCGKCGWQTRGGPQHTGGACCRCNWTAQKGGGWLEPMKEKAFLKAEKAQQERIAARVAESRRAWIAEQERKRLTGQD